MAMYLCGKRLLLSRNIVTSVRKQHGYIVLVPEIGEDAPDKNPLYQGDGLPEFNNITIENCRAAIAKQTLDFEAGVKEIETKLKGNQCGNIFSDVFDPLEELGKPLETTWGLSKTLYLGNSTLMPTSSYMAIHDRARRARASKFNSKEIFNAVETEIVSKKERNPEQHRMLKKFSIEGKLNGLGLNHDRQAILRQYLKKLNDERMGFKSKVEMATKQFSHLIHDPNVVKEFPENLIQSIATNSSDCQRGPWKLTIQPTLYLPLMEHLPDREARWNLWQAQVGRGSSYRDKELRTSLHVEEIRAVRRDIAKILGYETYVDMSMETKMAESQETVESMLNTLLERSKPSQEKELEDLLKYAQERGFKSDTLEPWDVPYWRRKQRNFLYNFTDSQLKEYFPLPKVLDGLFQLCEKLFDIVIRPRQNATTWHKDVKFYDIFEAHNSAPVAGFYLDPYARSEEKLRIEDIGWMVGIQNKSTITETNPLAALIFNFEPPNGEKPSHLTFKEVKSLFHKFGHALQHLMTRVNYSEVAGLSNVEWDAVEVSGHVMSHWLQNRSVLDSISAHQHTHDKLPDELFECALKSQRHMAGLDLTKQLYLSALDLELHSSKDFWLDVVKRLWPEYRPFVLHKIDSHPLSFTQIFSDEWGAAYYSHVWARMIAADVYSAFHEVKEDEQQIKEVGKRLRETFLAKGGAEHPSQVFREFRGRDPSPKALLKSLGLRKVKDN